MPRVSRSVDTLVDQPPRRFETELVVTPDDLDAIHEEPIDDDDTREPIAAEPPLAEPEPPSADTTALVAEGRRLERAGFDLLRRAARGHVLSAGERLLLQRTCPPRDAALPIRFERWLRQSIEGQRHIAELQARCGTPTEIAAAEHASAAAQDRRRTEGAEIAAKIAALQKQLADLADAAQRAAADLERRQTARDLLREPKRLPPYIAEELTVLQASIRDDRVACQNAKTVLSQFHHLAGLDPENKPEDLRWLESHLTGYVDGVRVYDLVLPLADPPFRALSANPTKFSPTGWARYLALRRVEADAAAETLQRLGHYDARIKAECDLLLSYWLPVDPEPAAAE